MSRVSVSVVVLMSLVVAGCTGVVVQDDPNQSNRYFMGDFDYAAGGGGIETIVVGNPFGGNKQAFDQRVRALMRHQNRGVPAEFLPPQSATTSSLHKVVVAFNLPRHIANHTMCRVPAGLPSGNQTDRLDIAIAFCEGDEVKAYTTGYARDVRSADDPRFFELVRFATLYMLPDRDPRMDDNGGDSTPDP